MFFIFTLSLVLLLLVFLRIILIKINLESHEYSSSFECGFDYSNKIRSSFSLRFFLIIVLFLIFDIELVLILPSSMTLREIYLDWFLVLIIFITILILGLVKEWNDGILEWY